MELVADAVGEVRAHVVGRVVELPRLVLLPNWTDVVAGAVPVLGTEEPWDLSSGEEVVDVLEELLLFDLVVREHERYMPLDGLEVLRA